MSETDGSGQSDGGIGSDGGDDVSSAAAPMYRGIVTSKGSLSLEQQELLVPQHHRSVDQSLPHGVSLVAPFCIR